MEKKFYTEDELVQMYQDGDITLVEFIDMHSEQWQQEYIDFCKDKSLDIGEDSAWAFIEHKAEELEKAMEEGNA
ncbi:MAG: hypothetical protein MJZ16_00335 [Bacteroidales bacterium]|nr:hypothetical protein [Bacteroidales bacterium]